MRDFNKLKQNMLDMIAEQQLKLGYMKETVRLYYLEKPLMRILGIGDLTLCEKANITDILKEFTASVESEIGHIDIIPEKERYCFVFSPEVSEYVHEHMHEQAFLKDLISEVTRHGDTNHLDEVISVFHKYSEHVHIEDMSEKNMDFDYLVYFEDGNPDEMYYCLTDEGCHVTYHRYMKEDYEEIFQA